MKRINFENGYVVDMDMNCMTLKKNVNIVENAKGEEVETSTNLGFFKNLTDAINEMYKDIVLKKLKKESTIEEAVKVFKRVEKKIDAITERFGV